MTGAARARTRPQAPPPADPRADLLARLDAWRPAPPVPPAATADRPAAVLVALVLRPEPAVLLTVRAATLRSHPGQVAFPGGRIEPGETAEAAALREAAEEVGLDPRLPRLRGRLPDLVTGTGFHVTPVVALLEPPLALAPAPDEVAEIFELPLATLLDPAGPERREGEFRGRRRGYWVWPHERHLVWGATAEILLRLATALRG